MERNEITKMISLLSEQKFITDEDVKMLEVYNFIDFVLNEENQYIMSKIESYNNNNKPSIRILSDISCAIKCFEHSQYMKNGKNLNEVAVDVASEFDNKFICIVKILNNLVDKNYITKQDMEKLYDNKFIYYVVNIEHYYYNFIQYNNYKGSSYPDYIKGLLKIIREYMSNTSKCIVSESLLKLFKEDLIDKEVFNRYDNDEFYSSLVENDIRIFRNYLFTGIEQNISFITEIFNKHDCQITDNLSLGILEFEIFEKLSRFRYELNELESVPNGSVNDIIKHIYEYYEDNKDYDLNELLAYTDPKKFKHFINNTNKYEIVLQDNNIDLDENNFNIFGTYILCKKDIDDSTIDFIVYSNKDTKLFNKINTILSLLNK